MVQVTPWFGETFDHAAPVGPERSVVIGQYPARESQMEAFLVSTGIVALSEMGDKTQLLALLLATKFRRPVPIVLGIVVATVFNHTLAGVVGNWLTTVLGHDFLRLVVGLSFLGMAAWTLIPDRAADLSNRANRFGVFGTTVAAFFLAEMGDKTQVATVALAAKYASLYAVIAGTTLGMLIADVPAVFLGDKLTQRIPLRWVHRIAAAIFAVLGALALLNVGNAL